MKSSLKYGIVLGLAFLPMVAFAQNSGADIYKAQCTMCHGDDGTGNTPAGKAFNAASFKDPKVIKTTDAERIVILKNGKNKMPALGAKMTDAQIKAVLAYIRTLQK